MRARRGDLLGRLGDEQPRARRERHDGVRVGLDREDEVRVQMEGLRLAAELVQADHGKGSGTGRVSAR